MVGGFAPRLFEPIKIGPLELKNRIVMPAMHLNFTPEGFVTDRMVEFYKERAPGGVAMVIVGASRITEDAGAFMMLNAYSEEALPGLCPTGNWKRRSTVWALK